MHPASEFSTVGEILSAETNPTPRSRRHPHRDARQDHAEFEAIHNIDRAREVGSVHSIVPAADLRPRLVDAVERGMGRTLAQSTE
ncbi:hypothetical protein ACFO6S_17300 [Rhodococcus kronopolitis]|uniref:Uncharacterized protein n=2 Tax=Rhodococcus kronopolitis TaxID=1460226 RepID=A0ABV9FTV9_9NOCA